MSCTSRSACTAVGGTASGSVLAERWTTTRPSSPRLTLPGRAELPARRVLHITLGLHRRWRILHHLVSIGPVRSLANGGTGRWHVAAHPQSREVCAELPERRVLHITLGLHRHREQQQSPPGSCTPWRSGGTVPPRASSTPPTRHGYSSHPWRACHVQAPRPASPPEGQTWEPWPNGGTARPGTSSTPPTGQAAGTSSLPAWPARHPRPAPHSASMRSSGQHLTLAERWKGHHPRIQPTPGLPRQRDRLAGPAWPGPALSLCGLSRTTPTTARTSPWPSYGTAATAVPSQPPATSQHGADGPSLRTLPAEHGGIRIAAQPRTAMEPVPGAPDPRAPASTSSMPE